MNERGAHLTATEVPAADAVALAEHAAAIRALGKRVVGDVIEIGRLLIECKKRIGHGNWLSWLEREFGWSDRTAERYISASELAGKFDTVSNLELPLQGLYLLSRPNTPEDVQEQVIARAKAGETFSHAQIKRLVDEATVRRDSANAETLRESSKKNNGSAPGASAFAEPVLSRANEAALTWTPDQSDRKTAAENDLCVLANLHGDAALIAWAQAADRFIRIDRMTAWGNPFEMPADGDRAAVIDKFSRFYFPHKNSLLARLPMLRGKVLGCWCHPNACHGDVIAEAVNGPIAEADR
jgi:hypothetical protein